MHGVNLEQALLAGAKDEEIYETINVVIEISGRQAITYARFTMKALYFFKEKYNL